MFRGVRAALLVVGATILFGCSEGGDRSPSSTAEVAEEDRYGGTAVIASGGDVQSVNPLTSSDATSRMVQQDVLFMPLVRYDSDLRPSPWLAQSWDTVRVAPDSLEITFRLRRDIRWHDGEPTTAEDVHFTFARAVEPRTAFPNRSQFDLWSERAEVVDSFTIRFRLQPHAEFLAIWYDLPILPEHILADVAPEQLAQHPFGTSRPVGNGPFRFVRRVPGQEWVFEANPDFPEELGGGPYLDRLVFRSIPEQTTLLTELLTGGIDVYLSPNPNQAAQLQAAPGVELLSSPYRAYTYIGWNTRDPLFADARVRRALTLAIDRQAIVDALLYGHGDVGISTSTPAHWAYPVQNEVKLPHDPDAAQLLLAEAGWADRDDDGILEDDSGRPFRFTFVTNQDNDLRRDVGQIVQAQLRPLGIDAQVRSLEWNTLIGLLDGSLNAEGERIRDFDAVISGWVTGFRKDDAALFHSRHINEPYQETGFTHPRIDALIDTLSVTTDREKAQPLWTEYHQVLVQESPYTVVYYPRRLLAHRERLRNVRLDVRGDLVSIREWWIAPAERR